MPPQIRIPAEHGGFDLKQYLLGMMRAVGHSVVEFGDARPYPNDDYPDFVVPLTRAVASGGVIRGVAVCDSGVGASIAANKLERVRACLIHDNFSARQGVEYDDLNLLWLGASSSGAPWHGNTSRLYSQQRYTGENGIAAIWPRLRTWKQPIGKVQNTLTSKTTTTKEEPLWQSN